MSARNAVEKKLWIVVPRSGQYFLKPTSLTTRNSYRTAQRTATTSTATIAVAPKASQMPEVVFGPCGA